MPYDSYQNLRRITRVLSKRVVDRQCIWCGLGIQRIGYCSKECADDFGSPRISPKELSEVKLEPMKRKPKIIKPKFPRDICDCGKPTNMQKRYCTSECRTKMQRTRFAL